MRSESKQVIAIVTDLSILNTNRDISNSKESVLDYIIYSTKTKKIGLK